MDNKILLIGSEIVLKNRPEWLYFASDFFITFAESAHDALVFLEAEDFGCVVVSDPFEFTGALEVLETVQNSANKPPVIYWCSSLTASEAVRLIQGGAADCFDSA